MMNEEHPDTGITTFCIIILLALSLLAFPRPVLSKSGVTPEAPQSTPARETAIPPMQSNQEEPLYCLYLPLMLKPTFTQVTLTKPRNWGLYSQGTNLAAAALATDINVRQNDTTIFAWNSGSAPPYSAQYTLVRSFTTFDLSSIPIGGTIAQAQMELYPWLVSSPTTLEIWRGTWTGVPTESDWNARGELLATVIFTNTSVSTDTPIVITLALENQPVPEMLYLVVNSDEKTPQADFQSKGAAFGLREIPELPGMQISKLHLWIIP